MLTKRPLSAIAAFLICYCVNAPTAAFAQGVEKTDAEQSNEQEISSLSQFEDCTIGNGAGLVDAQCATLTVPLDYNEENGQQIELQVAKLESRSKSPKADAFTVLAGGPGQSATETFPSVSNAFRKIQADRDIILLDQRGTGLSNKLSCPSEEEDSQIAAFDAQKTEAASKRCRDHMETDPQFFTTSVAVKDLEFLRKALSIPQWNLYGVSYGTRVGLHFLRRYPASVRTIALDAVVPPEIVLGPESAVSAQRALLRLFDRCENDDGCHTAFPNLRTGTLNLLKELKTTPVSIEFEDINTGTLRTVDISDRHIAITMRLMSYSAYGNAILPSMLYDAIDNNNFASLARQAQLQVAQLDESLAGGMYNAVICTEDEPHINNDIDRAELETTYLGAELLDAMKSHCSAWDAGIMDDDFKTPVTSDIPSLLFSGTDDPITPPSYAEQVAQHLSNSLHIVNEDQSHMQVQLGCIPEILAEFVDKAEPSELPLDCLERLSAPAFFVDANGPLP